MNCSVLLKQDLDPSCNCLIPTSFDLLRLWFTKAFISLFSKMQEDCQSCVLIHDTIILKFKLVIIL